MKRVEGDVSTEGVVPFKKTAVLVDPATSSTQEVPLPASFTRIRRITSEVSANWRPVGYAKVSVMPDFLACNSTGSVTGSPVQRKR